MPLTRPFLLASHIAVAVLMGAAIACTSTSLTGPDQSAPKCQVGVTAPQSTLAPGGGSGTIAIVAAPECQWTATSSDPWITNLTPASGQGPRQVAFTVGANPAAATRQGDISVNGSLARVLQDPAPCTFDVTPRTLTVASTTGTGSVTVTTPTGCTWTSASEVSWLTVTSPPQRTSAGAVTFDYAANVVAQPRIGSMTIAGVAVLVTQQAPGCTYAVAPTTQNVAVGGANGSVAVTAGQGCAWTAASDVPWLTVSGGSVGTGVGAVNFSAATNTGSPRTGRITVSGTVATVTQDGVASCQFSINPNNQNIGATGGSGSTSLTATAGCSWSGNSNDSWITLSSPTTGVSSSTVTFNVGANAGAARQGTLTVAGQTYTVNQSAAACTYNVAPLSQSVSNGAGPAAPVTVTTASHCGWTATVNPADTWVHIVGGSSGTGNGAVSINLDANGGGVRAGRLTIAGQAVTINQSAACTYQVTPTSVSVGALGGAVSSAITVTTQTGCAWTPVRGPADMWIQTPSPPNGSGSGSVQLSASANLGAARSGTVTIAGTVVTVSQSAVLCTYAVNPTSTPSPVGSSGGGGSFSVVTTPNLPICGWTASTSDTWVTITAPASGAGNGTVNFTVAANPGGARTGSITIPGATPFSIQQDSLACSFNLDRTSDSVSNGASVGTNITVTANQPTCNWTAAVNPADTWLQITGGASGMGNGSVSWMYDANPGATRSGTMTIAGFTFTVTQAQANCSYTIAPPTSVNFGVGAVVGASFSVTANVASCMWTGTSNQGWVQVTFRSADRERHRHLQRRCESVGRSWPVGGDLRCLGRSSSRSRRTRIRDRGARVRGAEPAVGVDRPPAGGRAASSGGAGDDHRRAVVPADESIGQHR